jgi:ferritin-like metal-binding protein YciE
MEHNALKEVYIAELKDLYDAENRLVKAIPKMAKAASSEKLRSGFEEHLEQTRGHVDRLKEILDAMGEKAGGKKCAGMTGIVKEGEEIMEEDFEGEVMDAALISAAQRVEHYEIAAYGCVRTWAELLGENEASALLEKTLEEEKETDQKLTELAEQINVQAKASSGEEEDEESEEETPRAKARGARASS